MSAWWSRADDAPASERPGDAPDRVATVPGDRDVDAHAPPDVTSPPAPTTAPGSDPIEPAAAAAGTEPVVHDASAPGAEDARDAVAGSPDSPGRLLRAARERHGWSQGDLAQQLKLLPRQIDAIERDDFAALPGAVFARGFVRNYARAVQLDPTPLMALLERALPVAATPVALVHAATLDGTAAKPVFDPFPRRPKPVSRGLVASAVLVLAIVGVALYLQHADAPVEAPAPTAEAPVGVAPTSMSAQPPSVAADASIPSTSTDTAAPPTTGAGLADPTAAGASPPAGVATTSGDVPAATASDTVASTATPSLPGSRPTPTTPPPASMSPATPIPVSPVVVPSAVPAATPPPLTVTPIAASAAGSVAGPGELRLAFAHAAWVRVTDATGAKLFSGTAAAGSEQALRGTPPYSLVVGNAAHVTVSYDGRGVDLAPHTRENVARLQLR